MPIAFCTTPEFGDKDLEREDLSTFCTKQNFCQFDLFAFRISV